VQISEPQIEELPEKNRVRRLMMLGHRLKKQPANMAQLSLTEWVTA
jgi:hypothetical protein